MEVDPAPAVRDKKRFEVKKVRYNNTQRCVIILSIFSTVERRSFMVLG